MQATVFHPVWRRPLLLLLVVLSCLDFATSQAHAEQLTFHGTAHAPETNQNIPWTITIDFSLNPPRVVRGSFGRQSYLLPTTLGTSMYDRQRADFDIFIPRRPGAFAAGTISNPRQDGRFEVNFRFLKNVDY